MLVTSGFSVPASLAPTHIRTAAAQSLTSPPRRSRPTARATPPFSGTGAGGVTLSGADTRGWCPRMSRGTAPKHSPPAVQKRRPGGAYRSPRLLARVAAPRAAPMRWQRSAMATARFGAVRTLSAVMCRLLRRCHLRRLSLVVTGRLWRRHYYGPGSNNPRGVRPVVPEPRRYLETRL